MESWEHKFNLLQHPWEEPISAKIPGEMYVNVLTTYNQICWLVAILTRQSALTFLADFSFSSFDNGPNNSVYTLPPFLMSSKTSIITFIKERISQGVKHTRVEKAVLLRHK